MAAQRSRRSFLAGVGAAVTGGLAGCTGDDSTAKGSTDAAPGDGDMQIFHAGSLAPPFSAAEPNFEKRTGIDITREPKGSVASTKKITQQGRKADILGVSDFRLIRDRVLPDHGNWYGIFATNAMSIQYREDSPGADEIATDNWWEVLSRDGVTIGHSDPAVDPGGYRAVMSQQLGKIEFNGEQLYDDATYRKLRENSVVPTGTETNLEGQLESGKLDYVIYYQSISASADKPWIDLQPEVDLSKATNEYAKHYEKATVETAAGRFKGAPIAYGLTVPSTAESPELGARWVEYFATEPGRQVLKNKGLQPVSPVVVPESGKDAVPGRVTKHVTVQETLGPLSL